MSLRILALVGVLWGIAPAMLRAEFRAVAMPYVDSSADAKSAALAGAVGALGGDVETLWANPAGLGGLLYPRISTTYLHWASGVDSQYLLSGIPLGRGWAVGAAVNRNAATDSYRDGTGTDLGSFEVSDTVLSGGAAYRRGWISVGASLKWVHERVETYRGSGYLADVGIQAQPLRDWAAFGVAFQNSGKTSSLSEGTRPPELLRCSAAIRGYWPFVTVVSECRYLPARNEMIPAVGIQVAQQVWPFGVAVRAGYDFQDLSSLDGSGWTGGLGLAWRDFRLDYMVSDGNVLGTRQRWTVGWEFQSIRPRREVFPTQGGSPTITVAPSAMKEVHPANGSEPEAPLLPSDQPGKPLEKSNVVQRTNPSSQNTATVPVPPKSPLPQDRPDEKSNAVQWTHPSAREVATVGTSPEAPRPTATPQDRMKVELEYLDH